MGITHATPAPGSESGDGKLSHDAWDEDHDISALDILDIPTAETDDTLVLAPNGAGGVGFRSAFAMILPPVLQVNTSYYGSGDPHVQTVTAPAGATILVVISETRAPIGVTQTNVTWTQRYAGNAGSLYTTIYTGAIAGAAGTSISADYASSTKGELVFIELDLPELTTLVSSTGNGTGSVSVSTPPLGTLCVASDGAFNANSGSYIICTVPHRVVVNGGCILLTIFYFYGYTEVKFIQSATRHTSLVALS